MSTPTQPRETAPATPAFVPAPRRPDGPPVLQAPERVPQNAIRDGGEPSSVYGQHPWLIPTTAVAAVIAVFVAMIVLTWAAGGITPFNR